MHRTVKTVVANAMCDYSYVLLIYIHRDKERKRERERDRENQRVYVCVHHFFGVHSAAAAVLIEISLF